MRQKYVVEFLSVPVEGITFSSNCVDIAFYNYGVESLLVNDVIVLTTNQNIAISGNTEEIDVTKYHVKFTNGGGSQIAVIVRRIYVN
jgi:hypothetical protein